MEITYQGRDDWPLYAVSLGSGPPLVLLHGGGPDHHSLIPLAERLADRHTIILPDVRGYGRSACTDPARHTWTQYSDDVAALLDHLGFQRAVVGGTGLGATITQRTCLEHPGRVRAAILISVEDIEDDEAKQAEIAFMDAFAERVRTDGIEAAWAPVLPELAPIIGTLVRDAIPRSDPASIAAAATIGHDRSFHSVDELAAITTPTLVFPGMDQRHPTELAENAAHVLPNGRLAPLSLSDTLRTAEDLADAFAPAIRRFLAEHHLY
ncbi:alpha/beta hydrolase [Amycolatopsis roodepoortensis]|uniref:alpha/beta fold hydrolase n=1 Tax=Amycolatopsis roodepoortensis TaxID=700274 RepID=UPI00214AFDD3|nr:alpha/beta hydrolase [Amycolatopsis roodepoortensis]UUV29937.1 alpha/beta hydrolase [Amycolatopsis roodepoortensis]